MPECVFLRHRMPTPTIWIKQPQIYGPFYKHRVLSRSNPRGHLIQRLQNPNSGTLSCSRNVFCSSFIVLIGAAVWQFLNDLPKWKIAVLCKKTKIYIFSRNAGGSGPISDYVMVSCTPLPISLYECILNTPYCLLHLINFTHFYPRDSPSDAGHQDPSPLNFLSSDELSESGIFVHPSGWLPLLKPCIYSVPSQTMGLWEKQIPWEVWPALSTGGHLTQDFPWGILSTPIRGPTVAPASPDQGGLPCCSPLLPGNQEAWSVPGYLSAPGSKLGTWETFCLRLPGSLAMRSCCLSGARSIRVCSWPHSQACLEQMLPDHSNTQLVHWVPKGRWH